MIGVRGAYWGCPLGDRPAPVLPEGYIIDEAVWSEVALLARAMDLPAAFVARRFQRGDRCWVAWWWEGDEPASWLWVSVGRHFDEVIGRELVFARDEAHGWGGRTREGHQHRGLFTAALEQVAAQMAGEGRAVMWNGVHEDGLYSQGAHRTAGYRPVLQVALDADGFRAWPAGLADPELLARARRMLDLGPATSPAALAAAHPRRP